MINAFEGVPLKRLQDIIKASKIVRFPRNTQIIKEGEVFKNVYIVKRGEI